MQLKVKQEKKFFFKPFSISIHSFYTIQKKKKNGGEKSKFNFIS